jgi:hypothetical protein
MPADLRSSSLQAGAPSTKTRSIAAAACKQPDANNAAGKQAASAKADTSALQFLPEAPHARPRERRPSP